MAVETMVREAPEMATVAAVAEEEAVTEEGKRAKAVAKAAGWESAELVEADDVAEATEPEEVDSAKARAAEERAAVTMVPAVAEAATDKGGASAVVVREDAPVALGAAAQTSANHSTYQRTSPARISDGI